VVIHVDDLLLLGNKEIIQKVKSQLSSQFDRKDLGAANFILGMKIKKDHLNKKLWLNQRITLRRYCRGLECKNVNLLVLLLL